MILYEESVDVECEVKQNIWSMFCFSIVDFVSSIF